MCSGQLVPAHSFQFSISKTVKYVLAVGVCKYACSHEIQLEKIWNDAKIGLNLHTQPIPISASHLHLSTTGRLSRRRLLHFNIII